MAVKDNGRIPSLEINSIFRTAKSSFMFLSENLVQAHRTTRASMRILVSLYVSVNTIASESTATDWVQGRNAPSVKSDNPRRTHTFVAALGAVLRMRHRLELFVPGELSLRVGAPRSQSAHKKQHHCEDTVFTPNKTILPRSKDACPTRKPFHVGSVMSAVVEVIVLQLILALRFQTQTRAPARHSAQKLDLPSFSWI